MTQLVSNLKDTCQYLKTALEKKDAYIEKKDAYIEERDARIKEKDARIKEKDDYIIEKEKAIGHLQTVKDNLVAEKTALRDALNSLEPRFERLLVRFAFGEPRGCCRCSALSSCLFGWIFRLPCGASRSCLFSFTSKVDPPPPSTVRARRQQSACGQERPELTKAVRQLKAEAVAKVMDEHKDLVSCDGCRRLLGLIATANNALWGQRPSCPVVPLFVCAESQQEEPWRALRKPHRIGAPPAPHADQRGDAEAPGGRLCWGSPPAPPVQGDLRARRRCADPDRVREKEEDASQYARRRTR